MGRAVVDEAVAPYSLPAYAALTGTTPDDWRWVVTTAEMAGGDWEIWRLATRDIPAAEWVAVEVMTGIESEGTTWAPWTR